MESYSMIQWLFFFYFYCFCGWCVESTYVSIRTRKLTNRGFLRGPFLPLYGSGAIVMLVVSMPFRDNIFLVYVSGCLGATVLEYVTGVTMEALFKVRYWDYSNQKFNFQGHICLGTTLSWGLLTVLLTRFVHVPVAKMVLAIPGSVLTAVTIVLTVFIGADFALSFKAAIDLKDLLEKMKNTKTELLRIQKRLDVIIASVGESLESRKDAFVESMDEIKSGIEEKLEHLKKLAMNRPGEYPESVRSEVSELRKKYVINVELRNRLASIRDFFQRDLLRSNPSMASDQYQEYLDELKQNAGRFRRKKRRKEEKNKESERSEEQKNPQT